MRLLLVEDNRDLAVLLKERFGSAGFAVDHLETAADAQDVLRRTHYSAVILDLGLPDRDGLSILRALRARKDATPVVVLTARGGLHDRVAGLQDGADDYIVKPFAFEELLARLRAVLRRPGELLGPALTVGNSNSAGAGSVYAGNLEISGTYDGNVSIISTGDTTYIIISLTGQGSGTTTTT